MSNQTKNILLITLSSITIFLIAIIIYLVTIGKNHENEMTGKIIVVGEKYIIVENTSEDYLIQNVVDSFAIGDEIRIIYRDKDIDEDSVLKTIMAKDIILLKSNTNVEEEKTEPTVPNETKSTTTKKIENKTTEKADKNSADEDVLEYVEKLEKEFSASSIKEDLKNGFITVVDFIFYDGTIKGQKFKDLTLSAKLKVLNAALYFDEKIEKYFPDYKESITSTTNKVYTNIKNEIVKAYLDVATKVCETNGDACETAKKGFATMKKNFGLTWSLIKEIAGDGLDKLKSWYEIFSGK